jgi:hypothetical protein
MSRGRIGFCAWALAVILLPELVRADRVISEIDYDQPGQLDSMEWIELHNPNDAEFQANTLALVLYRDDLHGNCQEYCRIDLSPMIIISAGSYVVIGNHPCADLDVSLCSMTDAIDNGMGGTIVLEQYGMVLDSVAYAAPSNGACSFTPTAVGDRDTVGGSMQRCGNSWIFSTTATPCAPNSCTTSDVPSGPARAPWGLVKLLYR